MWNPEIGDDGVEKWSTMFVDSEMTSGYPVAIDFDAHGNVYLAGAAGCYSSTFSWSAFIVAKYTPEGRQQWIHRYNAGNSSFDKGTDMVTDKIGNVYVTGSSVGSGKNSDYITAKYSTEGVLQWAARHNSLLNGIDSPCRIAVDGAANVYVTGTSADVPDKPACTTIKYTPQGSAMWVARYQPPDGFLCQASAVAVGRSGDVYVSALYYFDGPSIPVYVATFEYDAFGTQKWMARYSSGSPNASYGVLPSLVLDDSNNVYVTCVIDTVCVTIKYSPSGGQTWVKGQSPAESPYRDFDDTPRTIVLDPIGNLFGTTTVRTRSEPSSTECLVFKYNASGSTAWETRYVPPHSTYSRASHIAMDRAGNVYVTGEGVGEGEQASQHWSNSIPRVSSCGLYRAHRGQP